MSDESKPEYPVGYGKPPMHARFQKGRSGNPSGRPKEAKNFTAELERELAEQILVKEDGKSRRLSKRRAMIKRQVQKALQGDTRALVSLLTMAREQEQPAEATSNGSVSAADKALIDRFLSINTKPRNDDGSDPAA
jgi:Family of unknown function (DUF5681)